jgi:hypothetical protein
MATVAPSLTAAERVAFYYLTTADCFARLRDELC